MKIFVSSHFPRADIDRLQGAGLPNGRSIRSIFYFVYIDVGSVYSQRLDTAM